MGQVDARPAGELLVEARQVRRELAGSDAGQLDGPGRANELAGPAGLALVGLPAEGRADFPLGPAPEEVDRPAAHHLIAHPRAQPAEHALALGRALKRRRLHAQPGGKLGQLARIGGLGQEQLQHGAARLLHLLGLGANDQLAVDRVAAGGDELPAARRFQLDQAHPARPVRRQAAIVAERRNRDAHLPGGVEDRRAAGDLRGPPVDVQQNLSRPARLKGF